MSAHLASAGAHNANAENALDGLGRWMAVSTIVGVLMPVVYTLAFSLGCDAGADVLFAYCGVGMMSLLGVGVFRHRYVAEINKKHSDLLKYYALRATANARA